MTIMTSKGLPDLESELQKLMKADASLVHENANKDSKVFNTQRDLTAGVVAKTIGLRMLPPHVAQAHLAGDIHVHDLDYSPYSPMTNCCLIDFSYMFEHGFTIGNAEVERPKSIQTAAAQMAQIIANVSSSQYGGTSADRIDELLAPYARMNEEKHRQEATKWIEPAKRSEYAWEKTKKDIYDAMQSLEYEVNTLYTSNGQTPFVTFGFGLGTDRYEREIQRAILQVRMEGLGKEKRTAIFPKLVYGVRDGVNHRPHDPNNDIKKMAVLCATQRMYPDILNYDKLVELTGSYKAPMGCRSFLQGWKNKQGVEVNTGRMNLGVVTLNLPRIAMESKEQFWEILQERLKVVKDALLYRVERVKEARPENAPILYMNGAWGAKLKPEDSVTSLFDRKRATISLGYIGLYEVAAIFFGRDWEEKAEAKAFTLEILAELKRHCDKWSDEQQLHFSVYSTPSESLTDRFCRLDKERFGEVKDITDKGYYTNSFHYDVRKKPTPFEKIDFEKDYPVFCSGGFIHYVEYPNIQQNPKALEAVWDYSYDKIAYLGTNTPIDQCFLCGFKGEFLPTAHGFECPACRNHDPATCDVVKRTCGYLGNPQKRPMVRGRHKEITARQKHMEE
ncbi:anaerobic ribonucleoside-triphosphate reductase [Jeotgalibaca caeni]|uniref:anaerobic ribonucleoside-triphosphate reductase n=1 Tax=Jeotgalibaca caeni TaxID=3028623 RepID=UPI00237E16BC|nr:anaerobic ribonucleoside-triphosphate reductase [Jeotgalibaca caeni]MDE1547809.1 anaerobic ribonucleoside-triphosphate reductase [Jeotgalibaca caeni]